MRPNNMGTSNGNGKAHDVRIVVLPFGWVVVGYYKPGAEKIEVEQASVIRQWGTTRGLGQLALQGPTDKTVLDPCGPVSFYTSAEIMSLACDPKHWAKHLEGKSKS